MVTASVSRLQVDGFSLDLSLLPLSFSLLLPALP